jgi:hypothetical protein
MTSRKVPTPEEVVSERDEVRRSIVESLRLIVQTQYVLADLQENQRRLEALLAALSTEEETDGHPAEAANEDNGPSEDEHAPGVVVLPNHTSTRPGGRPT